MSSPPEIPLTEGLPGASMTSIFEGQPPKTRPFPTKTRVIWVHICTHSHMSFISNDMRRSLCFVFSHIKEFLDLRMPLAIAVP